MSREKAVQFAYDTFRELSKDFETALAEGTDKPAGLKVGFAAMLIGGHFDYLGEKPVKAAIRGVRAAEKAGDDHWGFVSLTFQKTTAGLEQTVLLFSYLASRPNHVLLAGASCLIGKSKITCSRRDPGEVPFDKLAESAPSLASFLYTYLSVSHARMVGGAYAHMW